MALSVFACDGEAREALRAEAGQMSRAIDELRRAHNDQKRPLLLKLESIPCSNTEVCEMKRVCSAAYTLHLASIEGSRAARRTLDQAKDGETPSGNGEDVAKVVARSREDLGHSKELMNECLAVQGALRRKLKL
jgi:hypothetical protein